MECGINKAGYFLVAIVWNCALLSAVLFLASWPLDIVGYAIDDERIRGYAYGTALLATIATFWVGLLAAILSSLVKCKRCASRVLLMRFPFFVSLTKCRCLTCEKACHGAGEANA